MFDDIAFFANDFIEFFAKLTISLTMLQNFSKNVYEQKQWQYIVRRGVDPWRQGQYGYAPRHKKKAFQSKANRLFSHVNKFEEVLGV